MSIVRAVTSQSINMAVVSNLLVGGFVHRVRPALARLFTVLVHKFGPGDKAAETT